MDFSLLVESLQTTVGEFLPNLALAIVILVVGWFVALVVRAIVRKSLKLVKLDEKVRALSGSALRIEGTLAAGLFYLILVFTLIAFFNQLKLPVVSEPLQAMVQKILGFVPSLIAGGVLIVIAWILATVLRKLATQALASTRLDDKLSAEAGVRPVSQSLGNVLYGLVLLLFLPAILGALKLEGLLEPIQGMVDQILAMLPNIVAAAVLGGVGWFVAKLLRTLVSGLLEAAGADKLGERAGLQGNLTLSNLVGLVVFIFVFVPALIAALNALKMESISGPATRMLEILLAAVPNLFAAGLILALAFFVARVVSELSSKLLAGIGFDTLPGRLGLAAAFPDKAAPSGMVGRLVAFFVILFAAVEAADVLGFQQVSEIVTQFIEFGGDVLLGVIVISVGLWISSLAHGAVERMNRPNSALIAGLVRYAILAVVFAMGLRAMGIADDIVDLAFGLTLGAVAVAVALSFGLGGREAAGKQMEHWLSRFRGEG